MFKDIPVTVQIIASNFLAYLKVSMKKQEQKVKVTMIEMCVSQLL